MQPRWQIVALLTMAALVVSLGGCQSGPKEPVYPVKGQLFIDDKPAKGAVVWFNPVDAPEPDKLKPAADPRPSGIVEEDGSFEVSTYGSKDGAPAGRYRIGVMWAKTMGGDEEQRLLSLDFMDPDRAGLPVVEVRPAPSNVLPPFKISR
jgi:hypothetical protein